MRILIETDGSYAGTIISFNDKKLLPPQSEIREFHISIHPNQKMKLTMKKYNQTTGEWDLVSMYGDDFKTYDELNKK